MIKNAKDQFLLLEKLKNTQSAQLCDFTTGYPRPHEVNGERRRVPHPAGGQAGLLGPKEDGEGAGVQERHVAKLAVLSSRAWMRAGWGDLFVRDVNWGDFFVRDVN